MTSYIVTPECVAAPEPGSSAADIEGYVLRLLEWRRMASHGCGEVLISNHLAEALLLDGLYPLRPRLRQVLAAAGVWQYDVNTIAQVAESFLRNTEFLQERLRIHDCLLGRCTLEPEFRDARFPNCAADIDLAVAFGALVSSRKASHSFGLVASAGAHTQQIQVCAELHIVESSDPELRIEESTVVEAQLSVCYTPEQLLERVDVTSMWLRATTDHEFNRAVAVAIAQNRRARGDGGEDPKYRLGRAFVGTLGVAATAQSAKKVIRAIVETVDHLQLKDCHILRRGRGANDPQVERNGDFAWRRDVDDELHLHYWECADGTIELADLVLHNNFSITA